MLMDMSVVKIYPIAIQDIIDLKLEQLMHPD
jgi:hypothetical protein